MIKFSSKKKTIEKAMKIEIVSDWNKQKRKTKLTKEMKWNEQNKTKTKMEA